MTEAEYKEAMERYCMADAMLMASPRVIIDPQRVTAYEIRGKRYDMLIVDDLERANRSYARRGNEARAQKKKLEEFAMAYGSTTQQAQRVAQATINLPKEPNMTPTEQLKQAQEAVIAAEKAIKEQAEREAFQARVLRDLELAEATKGLLTQIRVGTTYPNPSLATFRSELQPLANSYGYKLVLVGDKLAAVLVKV